MVMVGVLGVLWEIGGRLWGKGVFGYRWVVWGRVCMRVVWLMVWVEELFRMGGGGKVKGLFGMRRMIMGMGRGVKMLKWVLRMYEGGMVLDCGMVWRMGFMVRLWVGGMSGGWGEMGIRGGGLWWLDLVIF